MPSNFNVDPLSSIANNYVNNNDFSGVFGKNTPVVQDSSGRYTQNAPLNDTTQYSPNSNAPQYTAPKAPSTNIDQGYQTALKYAGQSSNDASNALIGGSQQLSNLAASNYAQKSGIDLQNKIQSSYLSGFNAPNTITSTVSQSNDPTIGNTSISQQQRNLQQQDYLNQSQHNMGIDTLNRQAAITSQQNAQTYAQQKDLAAQQQASAQKIAQTQATGNLYGALFSSINAPNTNYRYWS
jgi:hypothetical protein